MNAATMLGQAKTCYQAEIDSACELIDFWRFNVHFARELLAEQPMANSPGIWNRTDHRPLEGFVFAVTPFNFTAIAGNLPTAPALMGNVVVWKPSATQQLAASVTMDLLTEAGLPPGVVNMVPGFGPEISQVLLGHRELAGIHFTGSTATFQGLWRGVAENIADYRSYPRLVGETGGKDFVLAHPSADLDVLRTALVRGAFEYSGQKCSAAARAYVPESLWAALRDDLVGEIDALTVGSPGGPDQFHLGRHRRPVLRPAVRGHRPGPGDRLGRPCWPAGRTTTSRASSSGRPCCSAPIRATTFSAPSTSGRSCRRMSTPIPRSTRCCARWTGPRRTR